MTGDRAKLGAGVGCLRRDDCQYRPGADLDIPLAHLAGRVEGTGRVSLSMLHSAKGREFDAVVMYGVNAGDLPSERDKKNATALREASRLFYVGVTRPAKNSA
jgi:DNA helicase-2/ATP-dependent DNA helicase PcrA